MGNAARKIEPTPSPAAQRLAALRALPLREEPETEEEAAMFEEAEAFVRAGHRGHDPAEMQQLLDQMRRDQGE